MSEQELIEVIKKMANDIKPSWLVRGVGDDAAILRLPKNQVVSVDSQIENVHFRFDWASPFDLGRRATLAALSDLNAMGAKANAVFVSLSVGDTQREHVIPWMKGVKDAANVAGAVIAGGNLALGNQWQAHTSVIGNCEFGIRREGARPGHALYVSGDIGGAHAALEKLLAGDKSEIQAWLRPTPPFKTAVEIGHNASSAIDISDGFAADLSKMLRKSNVGAHVDIEVIPKHPLWQQSIASGSTKPVDIFKCAEDYQVLFTSQHGALPFAHRIGTITSKKELIVQMGDEEAVLESSGFDHFTTLSAFVQRTPQ